MIFPSSLQSCQISEKNYSTILRLNTLFYFLCLTKIFGLRMNAYKIENHLNITTILLFAVFIVGMAWLIDFFAPTSYYGKILPLRQWILQKGTDGQIVHSTFNNLLALQENMVVNMVERGESIRFDFSPNLLTDDSITQNDTIGKFYSSDASVEFASLYGELKIAQATLAVSVVGEKKEIVEEYRQRLETVKAETREKHRIFSRLEEMYKKNLTSLDEYELAQNQYEISKLQTNLAESQLRAITTGAKPEQIQLLQSQISSLEDQVLSLNERINNYIVLAPFDGSISTFYNSDTLLAVSDNSAYILLLPVDFKDAAKFETDSEIDCKPWDNSEQLKARVLGQRKEPRLIGGQPKIIITAEIIDPNHEIPSGTIVQCKTNSGTHILGSLFN